MAAFSQFLSQLYTVIIVFFTVLILELVVLARSITAIIHDTKNRPINTKQYLKIIEEKNPSCQFKKTGLRMESVENNPLECAICLTLFEEGESVRKLKCKHIFHRDCLDRWLQRDWASCPLCRSKVLPEEIMVKYRRFLNQQESQGSDEELIFLMSAFNGNFLRGFL